MTQARFLLREATAGDHARVDAAFARYDLADRASYGRFLRAHARVLPALETAIAQAPVWSAWRPRAGLLVADLAELGLPAPDLFPSPRMGTAARWGALYVLEGSRLGGAVLANSVSAALPRRYLSARHEAGAWPGFQAALDAAMAEGDARWLDDAIAAARTVFSLFERAAAQDVTA